MNIDQLNDLGLRLPLEQWKTWLALFLPKLAAGLFIMAGFWLVSVIGSKLILRVAQRSDPSKLDIFELIAQSSRIALIVFGTITAFGTLGINISALVAGLGLTGFALGFAFRDALSNVLAGTLIVLYRPFQRGDNIMVVGFEGTVTRIDLRYTTLQKGDKTYLIPNSTLFTNPISLTTTASSAPIMPL